MEKKVIKKSVRLTEKTYNEIMKMSDEKEFSKCITSAVKKVSKQQQEFKNILQTTNKIEVMLETVKKTIEEIIDE